MEKLDLGIDRITRDLSSTFLILPDYSMVVRRLLSPISTTNVKSGMKTGGLTA
ncbi:MULTISPECIES: hypothetical protein [Nitrosomonas]|uniref:Uncharacterized protein n=2 Tax=Nitrosomonas communis TaxID=44574 RepID=A0A5D3YAH6_9PROT|nr:MULTISPECIES: hypothetical protein [Nitrosomonas]TYP78388.1 hypothetical protein BCL69_107414 [Nitrosomonas communis]UVS61574.1 hypothetical protein NX761_19325 [Nitrosomonas sp. PLL12]UVS61600.1 hypothetical protein NX761_00130 [Nitrosomonas sp. PLL12]